jgi:uncharacterized protein (TIGR03084 family)
VQAVIDALAEQHRELADLVSDLDEQDWRRPTRCEGWTVADVVLHLAQTDELAIMSARGELTDMLAPLVDGVPPAGSIDDGADVAVARERGQPGSFVFERWQSDAEALRQALGDCDPSDRVMWIASDLSARTLATTRLAETWIHTGDVADAFGQEPAPTDRLWHIARLAWRTLPYAFAREGRELSGPVAFELRGPAGDAWDFVPDAEPQTVIRGDAMDLCLVAARRAKPDSTNLRGTGPDADAVLELVRTYA